MNLEKLVNQAIDGDKSALEGVIAAVQDDLYYLALRMLANPDDARDATQEILIKIITKLSTFKFQSQFKTWAYRIASNYLISEKKILSKDPKLTFDIYKIDLESDLQDPSELKNLPEYPVMLNELRISCTIAMLLCLNSPHRMAYILGDIYELEHQEASEILAITKANFRKQLSRARKKVINFTANSCGLVNDCATCSCEKKLIGAISRQRVQSKHIRFANKNVEPYFEIKKIIRETQNNLRALTLQNSITRYKCPIKLGDMIESLVVEGVSLEEMRGVRGM
ncbi:hypothetical protein MNBD_GAMMA07-1989 [hydrothermal vent metagenome]|uniref:RNA polymerase sigma-70 region 2 domain-containing protein n=1 Tax=hydrothermal vent metagenome TaxID=652676 RepID=A0A3B0X2M6_9ZZZZ